MSKKRTSIKEQAVEVFRKYPNVEFKVADFAKEYGKQHGWVPDDLDLHLRQMYAQDTIERPSRGVYKYVPGVVEEVVLPEPSGQFNIFHLL